MISTDFYEGIRKARPTDLEAIQVSLAQLVGNRAASVAVTVALAARIAALTASGVESHAALNSCKTTTAGKEQQQQQQLGVFFVSCLLIAGCQCSPLSMVGQYC
jgi:hypothetical protein